MNEQFLKYWFDFFMNTRSIVMLFFQFRLSDFVHYLNAQNSRNHSVKVQGFGRYCR